MKKTGIIFCMLVLLLICCGSGQAAAAETDEETYIEEQLELSGVGSLFYLLPDESKGWFQKEGYDSSTIDGLSLSSALDWIKQQAWDKVSYPMRLLLTIAGILLLSSLCGSLGEGFSSKDNRGAFALVSALAVCGALAATITERILAIGETIDKLSAFTLSFIPVFAGVAAAAGKPVSAIAYQSVVFGAAQLFSQILSQLLLPLLGVFLAVCLTGAVTDVIKVDAIASALKTAVLWILSFSLTIFVGLLTIRGLAGSAADTVANRAAKFAIGTFVPVVGSALSDAYTSLFACMGVVKNTVGIFGILAIALSFLPVLIELALMLGSVRLSAVLAETLEQKRPASVLKATGSVLSILLGMVIFYGMMMIVSVTILLMMGTGG